MMKTAGSRRDHLHNGRYADERHLQKFQSLEDLPFHEPIKATTKFYNGKINYGLLVRFLRGQTGNDWDAVYSEIISRIPTKLLAYKEMVFWFVADQVEMIDGRPWNKRTQQFIWTEGKIDQVHYTRIKQNPEFKEFYVDPQSNKLIRIPQLSRSKHYK
ncbi:hypothetical protein [Flavihumibacter petaseus]|uniref:Uncharacterized protein n=1 Tax=Flavihumibacter petaseus NBRC 106054 TaxID=1220578 RepID=A0A0E9N676_9BACT|nr:hypothetical protein [Flavihumibacter petaseus]GAO45427.1 hypothetical protein FPE01S_05_01220 [Flavihumibacter petaseus NBRC 106054]